MVIFMLASLVGEILGNERMKLRKMRRELEDTREKLSLELRKSLGLLLQRVSREIIAEQ